MATATIEHEITPDVYAWFDHRGLLVVDTTGTLELDSAARARLADLIAGEGR